MMTRKNTSFEEISTDVMHYLNEGSIETANLHEWLKVDQYELLKSVLAEFAKSDYLSIFTDQLIDLERPTSQAQAKSIGYTFGLYFDEPLLFKQLRNHTSDIVRCWGCWAECIRAEKICDLLEAVKPYAMDSHFGVREIALFASKKKLAADLSTSISLLSEWLKSDNENLRRFAIEVTRPIGIWTRKIPPLQASPERAIPLLEKVMADTSRYVQNSVANWLNDAAKTRPEWVDSFCASWTHRSQTQETRYIVKRVLRNIRLQSKGLD